MNEKKVNIRIKGKENDPMQEDKAKENGFLKAPDHGEGTDSENHLKNPDEMTKEELSEWMAEKEEESKKNYDLFLRAQAEMENLKKRHQKEKQEWHKFAAEQLIKDLLPSLDNLEMALSHTKNENALEALKEGIEMTLKGLKSALEKAGLKAVEAHGEPFDPCFHEAVSQLENDEIEAGHIIQELQKGYTLSDRLIRPAMVVVSRGSANASDGNIVQEKTSCQES
jgi:molecular chaperone GrpE